MQLISNSLWYLWYFQIKWVDECCDTVMLQRLGDKKKNLVFWLESVNMKKQLWIKSCNWTWSHRNLGVLGVVFDLFVQISNVLCCFLRLFPSCFRSWTLRGLIHCFSSITVYARLNQKVLRKTLTHQNCLFCFFLLPVLWCCCLGFFAFGAVLCVCVTNDWA